MNVSRNDYRIEEIIGTGSFGPVLKVVGKAAPYGLHVLKILAPKEEQEEKLAAEELQQVEEMKAQVEKNGGK